MSSFVRTLQLKRPVGRTLIRALVILVVLIGGLEWACRQPAVQERLLLPGKGTGNPYFDLKLLAYDQFNARGPAGCLFLGSSSAEKGIWPGVVAATYTSVTGEALRCFNYGVPGFSASGIEAWAEYLIAREQPRLLVVGLSPREFSASVIDSGFTARRVRAISWVRDRAGKLAPTGWLYNHSDVYRYLMAYRNWTDPHAVRDLRQQRADVATLAAHAGYWPSSRQLVVPFGPAEISANEARFSDFSSAPAELEALRDLLAVARRAEVTLVVVEVPLHPLIYSDFMGMSVYHDWQDVVEAMTRAASVPFWTVDQQPAIPADGWADSRHLNSTGADVFSTWLGDQLGQAVKRGEIVLPGS